MVLTSNQWLDSYMTILIQSTQISPPHFDLVMTAKDVATSEGAQPTEPDTQPETSRSGGGRTARRLRVPKELRLPRGVLVRVDVLQDEHGRIQVYTRERLSPGWSDERNEVASLLVRTGADVLDGFRGDGVEKEEEGEDDEDDNGASQIGPHRPDSGPQLPEPPILYRVPPPNFDESRAYG